MGCWVGTGTILYYNDSEGEIIILGGDSIGTVRKQGHLNMCTILNSYQDGAVWVSRLNSVTCLWGWLMNEVYKKKGEYTTRIARSQSGCRCLHKETWSAQPINTRFSYTSCEVHLGWRWDFRKFLVAVLSFWSYIKIKIQIQVTVSNFSSFVIVIDYSQCFCVSRCKQMYHGYYPIRHIFNYNGK